MIGRKLKVARSAAGLSLRALSDAIDNRVSAQAIGKYERDEDMPRSGVLLALADALELGLPPAGRYPMEHDGMRRDVALFGDRQRREFQQALGAGNARLRTLSQSIGLPLATLDTAGDPLDAVMSLLAPGVRR